MARLNFTGRKKILRKDVRAEIYSEDGRLELTAKLDHTGDGGYEFPDAAQIIIEARIGQTFMRFGLGTVADQVGIQREHLFEFDHTAAGALKLDVRVISPDGLLLGSAMGIPPVLPDEDKRDRIPLLPFHASDELGQRLWRLDLSADPIVEINRGVGDWNAFARQEIFIALVYPELIRAIAQWELDQKREPDEDAPWTRFLHELGHDPADAPDENDEIERERWLDTVTASFAVRHELLKKLELEEEG
jgi:hypothetical protein